MIRYNQGLLYFNYELYSGFHPGAFETEEEATEFVRCKIESILANTTPETFVEGNGMGVNSQHSKWIGHKS